MRPLGSPGTLGKERIGVPSQRPFRFVDVQPDKFGGLPDGLFIAGSSLLGGGEILGGRLKMCFHVSLPFLEERKKKFCLYMQ